MAGIFTASRLQVATYLLGICPFSIAFLVFLNSSVSFVITDLINYDGGVGDAVGSLGFADELLALAACPIWGLLSDRVGVRTVCVLSYAIIGVALFVFVQARNVYPQLLFGRLLFSLGGAAASTMVTAVLPTMSAKLPAIDNRSSQSVHSSRVGEHLQRSSLGSDVATAPAPFSSSSTGDNTHSITDKPSSNNDASSKIAGLVGMATGCGALIALGVFLPLPARFQHVGMTPAAALQHSYYIVGAVALIISIVCLFGLRNISPTQSQPETASYAVREEPSRMRVPRSIRTAGERFYKAFVAGFVSKNIALGYIGGFVARASSVGISLFIPLLVNAAFSDARLCGIEHTLDDPTGLPDIKRRCPRAYVVAAELTGVSQLTALICAPLFGYWSSRLSNKAIPLVFAAISGVVGYPLFSSSFDPHDANRGKRVVSFLAVCLIGISQIGAIVCSLGILSIGVLDSEASVASRNLAGTRQGIEESNTEAEPLIPRHHEQNDRTYTNAKGSIAGIYSFYGGAGILILTKAGGALFDSATRSAPFIMMAVFNGIMLVAGTAIGLRGTRPV